MDLQRLLSYVRRAVDDYRMIDDGDHIALAVSGGKDSLAMAMALKALSRFYPKRFTVSAYTVAIGFPDMDFSALKSFFSELEIPYHIIETQIKEIVFDIRKEENPCSLCAKLRKGALNEYVKQQGCNKIALGHHTEDVVETFLMSLFCEGRLNTFMPVTHLDRVDIVALRPLLYVPEQDIVHFANKYKLPVLKNTCPEDGYTKRQEMKDLLLQLRKDDPQIVSKVFTAIKNSHLRGWMRNPED